MADITTPVVQVSVLALFQYNETNVMRLSFSLLRIKGTVAVNCNRATTNN
jgi:hypothetical protein